MMRTGEISLKLRTFAETFRRKRRDKYDLLIQAADRLDEHEERIAIMTEHGISDPDLTFPPRDDEIGGD